MNTSVLLQAQPAGGEFAPLIMIVVIIAIMWFFMIRPQQKKQKEIRNFQNALTEGTKVIIGGGIYGTVKRIEMETNSVEVEIAKGTVVKVDRGFVFADASSNMAAQAK